MYREERGFAPVFLAWFAALSLVHNTLQTVFTSYYMYDILWLQTSAYL